VTARLYVYCVGDELSGASFEGLAGVGGARVSLLGLGRLAAAVSAAADEPVAVTEENLAAHNRVNAAALAGSTPLPFRFGTLAARERLADYAASNEASLLAALARVRGCVEMGVKLMEEARGAGRGARGASEGAASAGGVQGVVAAPPEGFDEAASLGAARDSLERGSLPRGEGARVGRGTAFLLRKRREVMGEEDARRRAEGLAAWLAAGVGELARESAVRVSPSEAIAVRAAHLVERERVEEYRGRLRALRGGRAGLRLLASGPWPPYSFSELRA
jgi:hypothetical protein